MITERATHEKENRAKPRRRCLAIVCAVLLASHAFAGEDKPTTPGQSIQMNFKDTPLETVLEQLSEMSGLVVVKDIPVEGRVTIISKQPMNVEEALSLLNSVLKEKGYVGIRTGRILKVVKLDDAKKRNIPVRTGADPSKIEATDEVFTQVIPIKYIDSAALKKDFAPLIPTYADLSANAGSNTLILTDTGANIRRIVEIIAAMDTQSTTVAEVKVFQLKFANAASAARLINDTFKEDNANTQGQQNLPPWMRGQQRFGGGGGGGPPMRDPNAGGDQADAQGARLRKVSASADERTNAVVVSASPDTMKIIAQVIKDLDSNPAEEQSVFTYRCKNAQADNLEAVINAVFGASGSSTINRSATQRRTSSQTGFGQDVQRGASSSRLPGSSVTSTPAPQAQNRNQGGGGFFQNPFAQGNNANRLGGGAGTGDLTGQVYVVADIDSNSLIVLTAPKNFERLKAIITELDKPVPQVLIKVLIAEVTHDKNNDIGVDISVLTQGTVKSAITDFGTAAATGGLITKLVSKDVSATLRALEGVGKLDILSRPYILASDNQLSSITVGQEVPFIISSRTTETGQTINTIQYQDIGIILNVTPHINEDGLVIMDVAPEVSSLTGTTVPISENASAPVFAKRSAQSRVGIKDGQTIVIGGLMEDKKTDNIQGVPILGRLPGLGTLFRRRITDKSKTELLIFLTPHVAHDPNVLKHMTEEEKAGLKVVPKAVRDGACDDHLEGLQRGRAEIVPQPEEGASETPPAPPQPAPQEKSDRIEKPERKKRPVKSE